MHITVAGKQVDTGEALRTHVREGLEGIAHKYFDHALEANVTFSRDAKHAPGSFVCDINLKAGRGLLMRGEGEGPDAHRAFTVAAEHVGKRLRRYRRRVNEHARSLADDREPAETATTVPQQDSDAGGEAAIAAEPTPASLGIVAEAPATIDRLRLADAALHFDLGGQPVLLFREAESGALNLLFRRPDGKIGWVDTATA